jgi:GrpB-like predicted nucleotidyltransferase (UPF0157 family)
MTIGFSHVGSSSLSGFCDEFQDVADVLAVAFGSLCGVYS